MAPGRHKGFLSRLPFMYSATEGGEGVRARDDGAVVAGLARDVAVAAPDAVVTILVAVVAAPVGAADHVAGTTPPGPARGRSSFGETIQKHGRTGELRSMGKINSIFTLSAQLCRQKRGRDKWHPEEIKWHYLCLGQIRADEIKWHFQTF